MTPAGSSTKLLFVTGNHHKVKEANDILSRFGITLEMADCEKVEIQSDSLSDIASYAASLAANKIETPVVVEDSGLFINALSGFPGPYSAFVFKTIGCEGVLKLMSGMANGSREACFRCSVSFCMPHSKPLAFEGVSEGAIALYERGSGGFGFDPVFVPSRGNGRSFSELSVEEKGSLSHRGAAFIKFAEWYSKREKKLK